MIAQTAFWLPLIIMIPLGAAVLVFLLPRWSFYLSLAAGLLTAAAVFVVAGLMMQSGAARHTLGGWGAPLGIDLVLDGIAMLLLLMTAVIGIGITLYAHGYFSAAGTSESKQHQYVYFWPLWMFLWAALNALFLSGDIFNLYVTLELLGFAAVALTALSGEAAVLRAAMRYLLVSLSGSLLYLMGVVFLYGGFGTLDIGQLRLIVADTPALVAAATLITVGLMMKSALFPLHFWLPPAHANAAAPVSAVLSALVVKGSFYILLRLWIEVFYPLGHTIVPQMVSLLGVGAIIWGSIQAIYQTRLKLLVAYSTVAQLGYLVLLLPFLFVEQASTGAIAAILCFILAHASAKAAAFLSAGNIMHVFHDDRIESLRGMTRTLPVTATAFSLAGVSLIALPPSGGFLAKWLMLDSALANNNWGLVVVIAGGGLLSAVYIMRVVASMFRSADSAPGDLQLNGGSEPISPYMSYPPLIFAVLAILLGFVGIYLLDVLTLGTLTLGTLGGAL